MRPMPRSLGSQLPAELRPLFDGANLASKVGETFLLLTIDADGWPHMAMLSAGELVLADAFTLHAALWLNSTATRNLEHAGRGLLALTCGGAGYYIRLTARRAADLDLGENGRLAAFVLRVEDVQEDAVSYAELTSGIRFRLHDPEAVVARWQQTIDALRSR
jgi:hypothetical protein